MTIQYAILGFLSREPLTDDLKSCFPNPLPCTGRATTNPDFIARWSICTRPVS